MDVLVGQAKNANQCSGTPASLVVKCYAEWSPRYPGSGTVTLSVSLMDSVGNVFGATQSKSATIAGTGDVLSDANSDTNRFAIVTYDCSTETFTLN